MTSRKAKAREERTPPPGPRKSERKADAHMKEEHSREQDQEEIFRTVQEEMRLDPPSPINLGAGKEEEEK